MSLEDNGKRKLLFVGCCYRPKGRMLLSPMKPKSLFSDCEVIINI